MAKLNDLTGRKFGRLTVIERAHNPKNGISKWKCICDCGNHAVCFGTNLTRNHTQSCGCVKKQVTSVTKFKHGFSNGSIEYATWERIMTRCYNTKNPKYTEYGGRGIQVCERWKEDFLAFLQDMGNRPSSKHSIDRKDVNGPYEPDNCRWATPTVQARNQRVKKNNKSGYSGVFRNNKTNKYLVSIRVEKKQKHIGSFDELEDAIQARKDAEIKYWNKSS